MATLAQLSGSRPKHCEKAVHSRRGDWAVGKHDVGGNLKELKEVIYSSASGLNVQDVKSKWSAVSNQNAVPSAIDAAQQTLLPRHFSAVAVACVLTHRRQRSGSSISLGVTRDNNRTFGAVQSHLIACAGIGHLWTRRRRRRQHELEPWKVRRSCFNHPHAC